MPLSCTSFLKVRDVRLHLRMKPSGNRWINFLGYTLLASKNKALNIRMGRTALAKKHDISEESADSTNARMIS